MHVNLTLVVIFLLRYWHPGGPLKDRILIPTAHFLILLLGTSPVEHADGVRTADFPMIEDLPRSAGISRMDSVAMETVAGKYS